jgi:hypothetical protein
VSAASAGEAVEPEVRDRTDREADRYEARVAHLPALLGEIEADCADERAGSEGEHETDEAVRPRPGEAEQRADDQRRRGERAQSDRLAHPAGPRSGGVL